MELSSGPAPAAADAGTVAAAVAAADGELVPAGADDAAAVSMPACFHPTTPKRSPATPAIERTVNPRGPTRSLRSDLSLGGLPRRLVRTGFPGRPCRPGRWPGTGLVPDPREERRRARH